MTPQKLFRFGLSVTLLVVGILSTNCTSIRNYDKHVQSWYGQRLEVLLASWGPPQAILQLPKSMKQYVYATVDRENASTPAEKDGMEIRPVFACKTQFNVDKNNVIMAVKWEGYDCREPKDQK